MQDEPVTSSPRAAGLEITLGDLLVFAHWMEKARRSLEAGLSMPDVPDLKSARVRIWMDLLGTLQRRWLESESNRTILEAKLQAQETRSARIFTSLYENLGSLHAASGLEDKARDARQRAVSCIRLFGLRREGSHQNL